MHESAVCLDFTPRKLQTGPPLLPMLIEGQSFIDAQDESSVTEFCRKYGMPERIIEEVFIPMAKALDFIDPDKLSMTVVLTAMNRFINETDGSQTAFLDGNQPDRLCKPMKEHIEARGGQVRLGAIVEEIVLDETTAVKHLRLRGGEILQADEYVSALPVDVFKRLIPAKWSTMPFFRQLDNLEGIPVINIHLWFDRKLKNIDALCFSRSPLLSVYADMSTCCKEYHDSERSMLELVFAPCAAIAGSSVNWIAKSDEEIVQARSSESSSRHCAFMFHVFRMFYWAQYLGTLQPLGQATMKELERLFPTEIGENLPDGARLRKSRVVKAGCIVQSFKRILFCPALRSAAWQSQLVTSFPYLSMPAFHIDPFWLFHHAALLRTCEFQARSCFWVAACGIVYSYSMGTSENEGFSNLRHPTTMQAKHQAPTKQKMRTMKTCKQSVLHWTSQEYANAYTVKPWETTEEMQNNCNSKNSG